MYFIIQFTYYRWYKKIIYFPIHPRIPDELGCFVHKLTKSDKYNFQSKCYLESLANLKSRNNTFNMKPRSNIIIILFAHDWSMSLWAFYQSAAYFSIHRPVVDHWPSPGRNYRRYNCCLVSNLLSQRINY